MSLPAVLVNNVEWLKSLKFAVLEVATQVFCPDLSESQILLDAKTGTLGLGSNSLKPGTKLKGFTLSFLVYEPGQTLLVHKNRLVSDGRYHQAGLSYRVRPDLECDAYNRQLWVRHEPVQVESSGAGQYQYTAYKTLYSNHVDVFRVAPSGELTQGKVGIVTHNDGRSFRLLQELVGQWQLYQLKGNLSAKPNDGLWLEPFLPIFRYRPFQVLVSRVCKLKPWIGPVGKEYLVAPRKLRNNEALVLWYDVFIPQRGFGLARLPNGQLACLVGGAEMDSFPPDADGVQRPKAGQIVRFQRLTPPSLPGQACRLLGVRLVS